MRSTVMAIPKPWPITPPWQAAMTVFVPQVIESCMVLNVLVMPCMRNDWGSRCPFFRPNDSTGRRRLSSPAQKSWPSPARMMTFTESSS